MASSGTIKTLAVLLVAMTLGTTALIWMETAPARPMLSLPLQATNTGDGDNCLALVRNTDVPLQYIKWRNIVIHDSGRDSGDVANGCHFIIGNGNGVGDGEIRTTGRWQRQGDGRHISVPGFSYNATSVGICLMADSTASGPTARQVAALASLVQALQATCQISPDHVYLHRELAQVNCPGPGFPADRFRQRLLPVTR